MTRWLAAMAGLVVLAAAASLIVYANRDRWLPEKVPTHWDFHFEPDAWMSRDKILVPLLILPGGMALMTLLFLALPWLSPAKFRIEPFQATYRYITILVMGMFAYMHGVFLLGYAEVLKKEGLGRALIGGLMLFLALLGNVLGKVRRNFWVGVRTPWTLASDVVWTRTHRLAAWLFVACGLVGFVLVLLGVHPLLALAVFGVAAVVPVVYSLWLYKRLEKLGRLSSTP
jgi:uncharacterized membrane protein